MVLSGTELILTHYKLDHRRERVLDTCQLLVGMPILASVRNLEFWLELCGVSHLPAAKQLLASFSTAKDPDQMCSDWNRNTIKQVSKSLTQLAGESFLQ